jgi:hypothetical protein
MDTDLAQALQTVERRLQLLKNELDPQEQELAALREKLAPLERSVAALQQRQEDLAAAATHLRSALEIAEATGGVASQEFDQPPIDESPNQGYSLDGQGGVGQTPRPKTIDGVVKILVDLGGSGSLEDIRREFRERGWLDPTFKNPDAALYAATKRLVGVGRIERLGGGRYRLISERLNADLQEGGM